MLVEQSGEDLDSESDQDESDDDTDAAHEASSSADDDLGDDEFEQAFQDSDLPSAPPSSAGDDEPGAVPGSVSLPEASGRGQQEGRKQANTKDVKATGVARAAARLLQQDALDGGVAILSVIASCMHTDMLVCVSSKPFQLLATALGCCYIAQGLSSSSSSWEVCACTLHRMSCSSRQLRGSAAEVQGVVSVTPPISSHYASLTAAITAHQAVTQSCLTHSCAEDARNVGLFCRKARV